LSYSLTDESEILFTFKRLKKTAKINKKLFPKKFKTCGKGDMTAVKPQKSSKGLTCYVLFDALVHNGSFNYHQIPLPASVSEWIPFYHYLPDGLSEAK
jgi:hypothetical protein